MPLQTRNATAYTYLGLCPACCPAFLAPVLPVGGSMYPGCYASDCSNWGIEKAFDADEATTAGTNWDPFPRMQFDLGSIRTDVQAVLIRSRADCCYWHANGLIVYVSEETDYFGGTVCIRGLEFGGYGEEKSVPCPAGLSVRYVTLVRWYANDMLGVSEVSVLATRKQSACLGRGGGARQVHAVLPTLLQNQRLVNVEARHQLVCCMQLAFSTMPGKAGGLRSVCALHPSSAALAILA